METESINYKQKPKHIDNYVIFPEELGQGQFSTVHKAINKNDKTMSQYFACKVISMQKIDPSSRLKYKEILQKEIDILVSAKHNNLIQLHDMKQTTNNVYLFLEYCNGGDLKKFIKQQGGRLSELQATQFFKDLVSGFMVLYNKKIIHRDLKPENILLNNGVVKIGDFGFARFIDGDQNQATKMSQKCSPLYAPPQIICNANYSSKCDIWSMGVVFYEMLYGQTPFMGTNLKSLFDDIENKTLKQPLEFPKSPAVSNITKDVIQSMICFEENQRISWEELNQHPIFQMKVAQILDLKFEASGDNPLRQSLEKYLFRLSNQSNQNEEGLAKEEQIAVQEQISQQQQQQYQQYNQSQNQNNQTLANQEEAESMQMESDDGSQYVKALKKIEQKEKAEKMVRQIDQYIHYQRTKTLFIHQVLLQFWNCFESLSIISNQLKCEILISLCCSYKYILENIKLLITGCEKNQVFKEENFSQYLQSEFCKKTSILINKDLNDAKSLYEELIPLCLKEISNNLLQATNQIEKNSIQNFINQYSLNQKNNDYLWYKNNFVNILKITLPQIAAYTISSQTLKSVYMLIMFYEIEKHFDKKKYHFFDFNKVLEDKIFKVSDEELKIQIGQFYNKIISEN